MKIKCFLLTLCLIGTLYSMASTNDSLTTHYQKVADDLKQQAEYNEALKYLNLILKSFKTQENWEGYFNIMNEIGFIYFDNGKYDSSEYQSYKVIDESVMILGEHNYFQSEAYRNLGNLAFRESDDAQLSMAFYKKSLDIKRKLPKSDTQGIADVKVEMAVTLMNHNGFNAAIKLLDEARSVYIHHAKKNKLKITKVFNNLSVCYDLINDAENAIRFANKALFYGKNQLRLNHPEIGKAYQNKSYVFLSMNYYDSAYVYNTNCIEIFRDNFGDIHPELGAAYYLNALIFQKSGQLDSALSSLNMALFSTVYNFENKDVLNTPNVEVKDINSLPNYRSILSLKAQVLNDYFEKTGDLEYRIHSITSLNSAIDVLEKFRTGYLTDISNEKVIYTLAELYNQALEINFDLYKTTYQEIYSESVLNLIERTKSLRMLAFYLKSRRQEEFGIPLNYINEEKALQTATVKITSRLNQIRIGGDSVVIKNLTDSLINSHSRLQEFLKKVEVNFPDYYKIKYSLKTVTISDIQRYLDDDELFIEYYYFNNLLISVVIDKFNHFILSKEYESLNDQIINYRSLVSHPDFNNISSIDQYIKSSNDLYKILFNSIDLTSYNSIRIIPHGSLNLISFETLVSNTEVQDPTFKSLPYLVRSHSICYAPSATLLLDFFGRRRVDYNLDYLAIAPKFELGSDSLGSLLPSIKGAEIELERLEDYFDGITLKGSDANENSFYNNVGNHKILHIASHAVLDNNLYSEPVIVLAPSDSIEDGIVHPYELYGLKINAELAILSACKTGVGEIIDGEGIMNLARGFYYTGCKSIVMALWNANDFSTSAIIKGFYSFLLESHEKDEALRLAKLEYLKNSDGIKCHPYYWGQLVVSGNTIPIFTRFFNYLLLLFGTLILLSLFFKNRIFSYSKRFSNSVA